MVMMAVLVSALLQDQVDNPEYKGWAAFKPGSSVTYKMAGQDGSQKVTLKSLGETEAVVETEITYNGKIGKAAERKVPAKVKAADAPKNMKEGEEEIEAGGKKLKCRTREYEKKNPATGKTAVLKFWINEEIPGMAVQFQTSTEGGVKFAMTASEWEKK